MILGILMICNVAMECVPVPNPQRLYSSQEECEADATAVAEGIPAQFTVDIYCYEVDYDVST